MNETNLEDLLAGFCFNPYIKVYHILLCMNTVYGILEKIFLHVYNFGLYENKVNFEKLEFKNIRS